MSTSVAPDARVRPLAAALALALMLLHAPLGSAAAVAPALSRQLTLPTGGPLHPTSPMPKAKANAVPQSPASIAVTSCADDGSPGTLRSAVGAAVSGDTIDATQLTCSTISLASGEIAVDIDSLSIDGPVRRTLTIDAGFQSRIFNHSGTGAFTLQNLVLAEGETHAGGNAFAAGGCIYSRGAVDLIGTQVKYCQAYGGSSLGGAIFAYSSVNMSHSLVEIGKAAGAGYSGIGGGIYTRDFTAKYSSVAASVASSDSSYAAGGGVWATGNVIVSDSTIGNNVADIIGGMSVAGTHASSRAVIINSTISGNVANRSEYGAGLYVGYPTLLANSTVSGNVEKNATDTKYGAGVFIRPGRAFDAESSAIGDNELFQAASSTYLPSDLGSNADGVVVTGANNLIYVVTHDVAVPADTLRSTANLNPLTSNGGETPTQLPMADSPLIGHGNTTANPGACDQRGAGYPRAHDGRVDIGAVQAPANPDAIFTDGFETPLACAP